MRVQFGEDKYKSVLMALWKICFPEDSAVFVDLYFANLYKNEEVLITVIDDQPIAFLQMLPCQIQIEEKNYSGGYIYGVMTHPDYRHKGYMNQLLTTALSSLKERACDYVFLIPQSPELAATYAKYGFQTPLLSGESLGEGLARILPTTAQLDVAKQDGSDKDSKNDGMLLRLNDLAPLIRRWKAFAMLEDF
ncbi:hypothetical protein AGMMS49525_14370 [Bacteroidia bacterium]|nr:hypothetical protein AGMMS49525_14370 [Bacteroidia bacterium]